MKIATRILCLGIFLAGMPLVSRSAPVLFDNFDTYADTAAFDTVWTDNAGAGLSLNTATFASSPNSVWNANYATAVASSREHMTAVSAFTLNFSFDFYDYTGQANSRDYAHLYSRNGDLFTGGLNNILRIGKYNNITTTKYYGYSYLISGVIAGNGASDPALSGGWFALGGAPDRSIGWHEARITGEADPLNPGRAIYKFYIDGVLGGSLANAAAPDYNWVVLGSGLTTASAIAFDNVSVVAVPEPSALLFGLLGMAAVVCLKRLRFRRS